MGQYEKSSPGRHIPPGEAARSTWFNSLQEEEVEMVRATVQDAENAAVFGLLAVLGGVRVVGEEKGAFELYYHVGLERTLLNPTSVDLHGKSVAG